MSNLEPIEEKDLDLKGKFTDTIKIKKGAEEPEMKKETPIVPGLENKLERKEEIMEKDQVYSHILSKVKSYQLPANQTVSDDAKSVSLETNAQAKVEKLVQLALEKGVIYAVKVARHLEDNYALDEFHDKLLADELHSALVQKGLIKEF